MIKLIAFDLWKTLIYRDVSYSTTSKMLDETGSKIPKSKIAKLFEKTVQVKRWPSKKHAYGELCKKMGLCKNKNLEEDEKYLKKLMSIRDKAENKVKIYPHSISMLKKLRKQRFKIGLITNSSHFAIDTVKEKTDVLTYIDYPVFSFNVEAVKPNPKMFKEILKLSGCKPKEVLMIGDSEKDDIIPAKRLGINAIHYKNYPQLRKDLEKYEIFL